jgi:HTH-type transcriptional repressor of NAD biosynthesis genes
MKKGKVGFYGGKFLPLHQGHVYMITRAACMVDELYVVLSYSKIRDAKLVEKGNIKKLPFELRLRWLSQMTKDMENVKVLAVEDLADSDESYDWVQGAREIKKAIGKPIDVVFGSEESYRPIFNQLYPNAQYEVIDPERKMFPISATQIRTDGPFKHWEYIPNAAKSYFVKTVAIVGTESCGKSTLTRYLAAVFNTTYTEEYGRIVTDELGGCENIMTAEDYYRIQYGHKMKEEEAKRKANKVTFIDSEAIVTQYYAKLYNKEQYPLIEEIVNTQYYDLWLFLEPDVPWVDDGTRTFGEEQVRQENNRLLKEMLDKRNIRYEIIDGGYEERFCKAYDLVNEMLLKPKHS